ncbi:MAG: hypothetical protein ACPG77_08850, partial [Nannocystaceae bacterium]
MVSAELVFELPAGEEQPEDTRMVRLPIDPPPPGARTWNHHYAWKLASLSVEDRVELTYWVEVRDNDPGLGTSPLEDPPGKVTRSAAMQLRIEDAESRHEDNLVALREIRDAAVDLLATRLTSPALAPSATADELSPLDRLFEMHSVLGASASLLGQLNLAIDALSVDTLSPERDVAVLTAIHERLLKLHREETLLHEDVRVLPGGEQHPGLVPALRAIARHNPKEVTGLEDEIIRLDDLVDTQIIEQIEGLVARLQTSQQRLVELLEALKAGDESVRAELELLHQRVLEDLRRVAQARSMLSKEVGSEFLNTDAFEAMQDQVQHQDVMEQLRRGEIDKALESARSALSEIQQLRDDVQGKLAEAPQASLSPEEQARLEVLRELSRIQDAQSGIRAESRKLHQQQRDALTELEVDSKRAQELKKRAKNILDRYADVRDARLGRQARNSFEDSRQALKHLVGELEKPEPGLLSSAEQADKAARAAASAAKHGQKVEGEAKKLARLKRDSQALRDDLRRLLPKPAPSPEQAGQFGNVQQTQQSLQQRAQKLLESEQSGPLPKAGKDALKQAAGQMTESADELGGYQSSNSLHKQKGALQSIEDAIASLRKSSPPPPTGSQQQ